nr:aminotransferase class V-fold PLP-dependent enzyme [Calditrichia bacterium]NIV71517.1 aminotransferase class V-fold PLP-dependent enzyme [Calditrichia bacterium]NIV98077.1 aminotransferase class V-fold PLP-dependent enzyme [Candidatus Saccharibacteria bacterium]NIW78368.1 aminotransferase class V-fold PLP-dependent enzyme [Calditrichia bacterium]
KGIGAVYIRRGTGFEKMLSGGAQENNHRAGTENVAGIVGLAKAAKLCYQRLETDSQEIGALRNYLEIQLQQRYDTKINGHPHNRLYNILNVSFPGCDSETLLMSLDMKGIAVSTGSACDSGSIEPSHVLKALGMPDSLLKSGIRFSLGKYNTREEIDRVLNELQTIIPQLQKL